MDASGDEDGSARSGGPDGVREVGWSARRMQEVVLRLLRGGSLDALARETGRPAGAISAWREALLDAGQEGLKSRPRPLGRLEQLAARLPCRRTLRSWAC